MSHFIHFLHFLAEIGDYDPLSHPHGYVSEFRFIQHQVYVTNTITCKNYTCTCKIGLVHASLYN